MTQQHTSSLFVQHFHLKNFSVRAIRDIWFNRTECKRIRSPLYYCIVTHVARSSIRSTGTPNPATNGLYSEIHFEIFVRTVNSLLNVASERHVVLLKLLITFFRKKKYRGYIYHPIYHSESELPLTYTECKKNSSLKCLHQ